MFKIYQIDERPPDPGPKSRDFPIDTLEWEFNILLEVFKDVNPKKLLEIGTYYGGTLYQWIIHGPEFGKVISVDDNRLIKNYWQEDKHFEIYLVKSNTFNIETVEFVEKQGPYEFSFLNGKRRYENAYQDWLTAADNSSDGSVIAIHNILEKKRNGVNKLWREIQKKGYITQEVVAENSNKGIGIVYL